MPDWMLMAVAAAFGVGKRLYAQWSQAWKLRKQVYPEPLLASPPFSISRASFISYCDLIDQRMISEDLVYVYTYLHDSDHDVVTVPFTRVPSASEEFAAYPIFDVPTLADKERRPTQILSIVSFHLHMEKTAHHCDEKAQELGCSCDVWKSLESTRRISHQQMKSVFTHKDIILLEQPAKVVICADSFWLPHLICRSSRAIRT